MYDRSKSNASSRNLFLAPETTARMEFMASHGGERHEAAVAGAAAAVKALGEMGKKHAIGQRAVCRALAVSLRCNAPSAKCSPLSGTEMLSSKFNETQRIQIWREHLRKEAKLEVTANEFAVNVRTRACNCGRRSARASRLTDALLSVNPIAAKPTEVDPRLYFADDGTSPPSSASRSCSPPSPSGSAVLVVRMASGSHMAAAENRCRLVQVYTESRAARRLSRQRLPAHDDCKRDWVRGTACSSLRGLPHLASRDSLSVCFALRVQVGGPSGNGCFEAQAAARLASPAQSMRRDAILPCVRVTVSSIAVCKVMAAAGAQQ